MLILIGCHSDPISTTGETQPTLVGGTITSDTTWRAKDGPYHIIENIVVPDSVWWQVEAGTEIIVAWNQTIEVFGNTRFQGDYKTRISVWSEGGVWQGFRFTGEHDESSFLNHIDISNPVIAVEATDSAHVSLHDSRILSCDSIGVRVNSGAMATVWSCEFTNDRTLNLLNPVAISSAFGSHAWVYNTQINGFHHGIRIQGWGYPISLESNQITACDIGIISDSQDSTEIIDNQFLGCKTGILITQGSPTLLYNTFEKQGECVRVEGLCQPEAHWNSFADPDRWAWVHYSPYDVDATNNWWGTADPDSIDQLIYDHNDDPQAGYINYEPFLTSAP